MGRHKDPDSIKFIEWLERKGNALGYYTDSEFAIGDNGYFIDMVWKYNAKQNPMITFEVETSNESGIFKNTMKIFGTEKSHVKKPYHHFAIILKNLLTKGQKDSLHLFLNHWNISLYENIFNDESKFKELESELDNLEPNPLREGGSFINSLRSNIFLTLGDIGLAFSMFGKDLPFLLKDDFVPAGEKHIYERAPTIVEYLKNRLHEIRSINDLQKEDLESLIELAKLVERIDVKESVLLTKDTCPKCGARLTQKQFSHGGNEDDGQPYAVTYIDGCESCDYELNRETIEL